MSQHEDDSDSSFHRKSFTQAEDRCNQPLRKPRMQCSSEERTESPQSNKSILQKRLSRGSSAGQFVSPAKAEPELKMRSSFVLSPDAKIFVPKAQMIVKMSFSVQDRLKKLNLRDQYNSYFGVKQEDITMDNTVIENGVQNMQIDSLKKRTLRDLYVSYFGVKQADITMDNTVIENGVQNMQIDDGVKSIVETLETFVINLIRDPGLYDKVLETFMSFLSPYLIDPTNNIMIISDTASMLFMHAVENPNFRYSGARLCITIADCSPEFQAKLLLLCDRDINSQTENIKGLLLFIAELYMNKTDNSKIYGNMLFSGFDVLLCTQTEDNVVAACQVLKLTGSKISVELPSNLEEILHRLHLIKPTMRNNIQGLIESVKKNCEVQLEETPMSDSKELEAKSIPGMEDTNTLPIFIGQDGIEIGIEDELCSGDDDSDMEEMYVQYEEFLKLQK